ncbi:MAG: ATPase, T2SS/T4P/T4SS family [Patescibacteria group bacterium]
MANHDTIEDKITNRAHLSKEATKRLLDDFSQVLAQALKKGETVTITNEGQFHLHQHRLPATAPKPAVKNIKVEVASSVLQSVAHPTTIEFIDLKKTTLNKSLLSLFPQAIMQRYQMVPIGLDKTNLRLAMVDPENMEAIELVRKTVDKNVIPLLTTKADLARILDQGGIGTEEIHQLANEAEEIIEAVPETTAGSNSAETTALEHAPAAKLISQLIRQAVHESASDIHLEPFEENSQIRLRIDGVLRTIASVPQSIHRGLVSRIKVLANLRLDEHRLPQDGRFRSLIDNGDIDFRVSLIPTVDGEKVVLRILDKSAGILTLEQVGLRGQQFALLEEEIHKPHGMILVTGPTGSGKTTTLYAAIDQLRSGSTNITTLEDPVEYRLTGINQSQINPEIGFTFAAGLRAILRQDPNIILVGEIRDAETADIAINAALTGHIVLSTLHTNDAAGAIPRLLDMGIEPFLITSSVNAVVAQRLVRQICQKCKTSLRLSGEHTAEIRAEIRTIKKHPAALKRLERLKSRLSQPIFYMGKGCDACGQTGYRGRAGIYEILPVTEALKPLIGKNMDTTRLALATRKMGMLTMRQDGLLKALDGLTTIDEVWRVTKV